MDAPDLTPLLEQLEDNVDDLEEVLEPVLGQSLAKLSKNLPVMDRAKIHVLITYTLESLIFCKFRSTFSKQSA
jgi:exosome complex protein LRP1